MTLKEVQNEISTKERMQREIRVYLDILQTDLLKLYDLESQLAMDEDKEEI